MSQPAIKVENLGKRYVIGSREQGGNSFREMLTSAATAPFRRLRRLGGGASEDETIWALKDVSFEVGEGEAVGIVGRNGAGKSTLLKILSRISAPTEGRVDIRGRVASLLEVGTGFHPELTGRENIYLNGAILGMSRSDIVRRFDEIVDFAGVEKFLDTPVKRYSSGMYVRLAFAVAAHLEPEVLIVDEVLAVGDADFQKKCLSKMGQVSKGGRTVILVSHNMAAIQALCTKAFLLESGKLVMSGEPNKVVAMHLAAPSAKQALAEREDRKGSQLVRFTEVEIYPAGGERSDAVTMGADVVFELAHVNQSGGLFEDVELCIGIYDAHGRAMTFLDNRSLHTMLSTKPGHGVFRCTVRRMPLMPGDYFINLHIHHKGELLDWIQNASRITVHSGNFYGTGKLPYTDLGGVCLEHAWS